MLVGKLGKDHKYNEISNDFMYKEDIYAQKNKEKAESLFKL